MERLKESLLYLDKALKTLVESFEVVELAKQTGEEKLVLATYDSMIQRFEYCYEDFWKFLKLYIKTLYGVEDIHSPKGIFRETVKLKLCTEQQGEILIKSINLYFFLNPQVLDLKSRLKPFEWLPK